MQEGLKATGSGNMESGSSGVAVIVEHRTFALWLWLVADEDKDWTASSQLAGRARFYSVAVITPDSDFRTFRQPRFDSG